MSTKDISRFLFQPRKRYSSVRMQQGRVILDSDWNESERIDDEEARRTLIDVICSNGTSNRGFRVGNVQGAEVEIPGADPIASYNFDFENGSFYIGGLRFESETDGNPETFLGQNDWLQIDASADSLPVRSNDLLAGGVRHDLIYLRGWEQCVTAVEDSELLERALGGPDASVRIRRMRRVEALTNAPDTCAAAFDALKQRLTAPVASETGAPHEFDLRNHELKSIARLTVVPNPADITEDPCKPAVPGGYLGADNQTIRVQLTATDRFIWGYDNAAPLYRVQVENIPDAPNGIRRKIRFLSLPHDQAAQPLAGQAVEIIPWGAFLPNKEKVAEFQGKLFTVETSFDPEDGSLTITQPVPQKWIEWLANHQQFWSDRDDPERKQYFYLRLWTGGSGIAANPDHQFTPDTPVSLEGTGLSVRFSDYGLPGDFWIIAARPNTPDLVVPWELLDSAPPAGPRYFFAPLALIRWSMSGENVLQASVHDCRDRFRPLCDDLRGCCTVIVGDGVSSHGDFDSIEEAVEALPASGGEICLLPGQHRANVKIIGRRNITIKGRGKQTRVVPRESNLKSPIFYASDSPGITLREMELVTVDGTAITMEGSRTGDLKDINIVDNRILAYKQAIQVQHGVDIQIENNDIRILDKDGAGVAIQIQAEDSIIEHNNIGVGSAEQTTHPDEQEDNPDPTDPGVDREIFYGNPIFLSSVIDHIFGVIIDSSPIAPFKALGGIQIVAVSQGVKVLDNSILGGAGNGITLGSEPPGQEEKPQFIKNNGAPNGERPRIRGRVQQQAEVGLPGIALLFEGQTNGERLQTVTDFLAPSIGNFDIAAEPRSDTEVYKVSLLSLGLKIDFIVINEVGLSQFYVIDVINVESQQAHGYYLYEIQIDSNEIAYMGLSGIGFPISASRILGPPTMATAVPPPNPAGAALLDQYGNPVWILGIRHNYIHECLQNSFDGALRAEAIRRGFGGISLGYCEKVTISENRIEWNGKENINPACGIFIMVGVEVDIYHNYIVGNGGDGPVVDSNQDMEPGLRGGILLFAFAALMSDDTSEPGLRAGMHAARLHGNIVHQQAGHALHITSLGAVSICDNQLVAQIPGPGSFGGALLVRTEGSAPDLPDGLVLFNNNQSWFGRPAKFPSQAILTGGHSDISFNGNQSTVLSLSNTSEGFMNTILVGYTIRAIDNRFIEPTGDILGFLGTFGQLFNNTSHNQCDHCIVAKNRDSQAIEKDNQILYNGKCSSHSDIVTTVMSTFTFGGPISPDWDWKLEEEITEMANSDDIVRDSLINNLRRLKGERIAALSGIMDIRVAMQAFLHHEAQKLEEKLGAKHPRVRQMKSRLKSNLQIINSLEIERQLARIEAPQVEGEAALVHGRVVDEDGRGIEGLTVCLMDQSGSPIRGASEHVTDASGYFAFALEPETVDNLNKTYRTGIFPGVVTKRRRLVYRHLNPLTLARSARLLVEISLKRLELISEPSPTPTAVIVPNLVSMIEKDALATLQDVGLQLGQRGTKVAPEQDGHVLDQSPAAGSKALPGSSVSLVIAIPRGRAQRSKRSTKKKR